MNGMQRSQLLFFPALSALFLFLTATLLPGQQAWADELLMKDGSRLIGEVVKREHGTLEFKTSYAGVIKVNWNEVAELHADEPMKLMLDDESISTAKHIKSSEDGLIVYDDDIEPDLSEPSLAQDELAYINPEPWRTGEGHKLDGHINFALERERGNTDKDEIDVDGDVVWRFRKDRVTMFGELERDRNNNEKTKDKWKLDSSYDHFVTKQWFAGGYLGFEHDRFADLNLRTVVGPKLGYQWFEGKEMNLSTAAGPMYVDEDFDNDPDDDYIALGWGIDFDKYLFSEIMQLYHRQTGLWSMDDTGDVVWNTWTGLRFPLVWRFIASTEIKVEYDGGAAENKDDTDTTYSLKIGYQW
jgi:putative salt-induced outer membrane protein YdiY